MIILIHGMLRKLNLLVETIPILGMRKKLNHPLMIIATHGTRNPRLPIQLERLQKMIISTHGMQSKMAPHRLK